MNNTKKKIALFSKIESREDALKTVKDVAYGFFFVAALQAVIGTLVLKQYAVLIDAFLYLIFGFLVWRFNSRVAAVFLLLMTAVSAGVTVANKLGENLGGGTNIFLALIVFWGAIRGVEATFKLNGRFALPKSDVSAKA